MSSTLAFLLVAALAAVPATASDRKPATADEVDARAPASRPTESYQTTPQDMPKAGRHENEGTASGTEERRAKRASGEASAGAGEIRGQERNAPKGAGRPATR